MVTIRAYDQITQGTLKQLKDGPNPRTIRALQFSWERSIQSSPHLRTLWETHLMCDCHSAPSRLIEPLILRRFSATAVSTPEGRMVSHQVTLRRSASRAKKHSRLFGAGGGNRPIVREAMNSEGHLHPTGLDGIASSAPVWQPHGDDRSCCPHMTRASGEESRDALHHSAGRSNPPELRPCVGIRAASAEATKHPPDTPRGNWPPCADPAFEDAKGGAL